MNPIGDAGKISIRTEPLAERLEKRDHSFSQRLTSAVMDVNEKQIKGDEAVEKVIRGEMGIHEGMIAMGKADVSLRLLVQVRAKVMAAYQEVIRMQI